MCGKTASFFSIEAYLAWGDFPLITSVSTTSLPIEDLAWPSVTLCNQGRGLGATERVYNVQLKKHIKQKGKDVENLDDAQKRQEERQFLEENYPGLGESPINIVSAMTSSTPDSAVEADIISGELFECDEDVKTTTQPTTAIENKECEDLGYNLGTLEHSGGKSCYSKADQERNYVEYSELCQRKLGRLLDLTTENEFLNLFGDINTGVWLSAYVANGNAWRWKHIIAKSDNVSEEILSSSTGAKVFGKVGRDRDMSWLKNNGTIDPDVDTFIDNTTSKQDRCLFGQAKSTTDGEKYLDVHEAHCTKFALSQSICEKTVSDVETFEFTESSELNETTRKEEESSDICVSQRRKRDDQSVPNIDLYLNPDREKERERTFEKQKKTYQEKFASMDSVNSFPSVFELLWYSGTPCFDVAELTSDKIHEKSVIKQCLWKGEEIDCSQVFTLTPTDKGMCCRFDLKKPKNIFTENMFTKTMENLQNQDKANAFDKRYGADTSFQIDLKPEVGRFKGLTLVLDAHSDLLSERSVEDDSNGFLVGLTKSGEFPLMGQGTHLLKPGNEHFLSLTAIDTISDIKVQSYLKPEKRKCYFPHEKNLQFHSNYSQSACLFECGISWAKDFSKLDCLPWYFPPLGEAKSSAICDPWDTQLFMEALRRAPRSECRDCLSDCQTTSFTLSASAAPFRTCTDLNKGLSNLCKYSSSMSPSMSSEQILQEYSHLEEVPEYIKKFQEEDSSRRLLNTGAEYDAFKQDIALVHIYWDTSSVLQFERALRLTWIDYISQVNRQIKNIINAVLFDLGWWTSWSLHRV